MTVSQAATGTGGPYLGRVSGVSGTPNMRTGTYSIALRVKWATTATNVDMTLAVLGVQADGRGFYVQRLNGVASTSISCYRYDGFVTSNVALAAGAYGSTSNWVHICATYDGTTIRTYVDGVASGTIASTSTLIASGVADFVSCAGTFTGDIADVVMFSRALSAAEALQLSNMRLPMMRQGDCIAWWPMIDTSSLSAAGKDFSGTGNDCTLQASGANNPSASQVSVPELWSPLGIVTRFSPSATAIDGSGNSSVSASGAISEAVGVQGSGQSSVSASAAISVATALVGTGQSSVSASATGKEAAALSGTGASSASGSAALSEAVALLGTGQVSVSGSAAVTSTGSGALDGSGNVSVSGAAAVSSVAAVTGSGNTSVAASAAINQQRDQTGTGASSVSATGTVSRQLQLVGSGDCAVSGSAAVSVAYALTGTGQVAVGGAGSLFTPSGGGAGDDQPVSLRWLAVLNTRRRVRR